MVSALDSRLRGQGLSPHRVIVLCSWARHLTLTVTLSTQEYKWAPANCQGNLAKYWEVTCDGQASHPGGVAILLVASCYGNWDQLQQKWATRCPDTMLVLMMMVMMVTMLMMITITMTMTMVTMLMMVMINTNSNKYMY